MSSVNKVILIGNVGSDPDVRYLDRGVAIANFNLATTERGYTMQNGTQVPDKTDWHSIVLWRNLAEWAERNIRKSMKLYVEGNRKNISNSKTRPFRRKKEKLRITTTKKKLYSSKSLAILSVFLFRQLKDVCAYACIRETAGRLSGEPLFVL